MIESVIFYFLAALVLVPALLVVALKNVFHCALYLVASLFGVAGLYAFLAADFLFAVQLLVYVGGIMVVLLFVVLLSGKPSDWKIPQLNEKAWAAALYALFFVVAITTVVLQWPIQSAVRPAPLTTGRLGEMLLKDMILPFEVISLVLVAALVGAIYFSSKKPSS